MATGIWWPGGNAGRESGTARGSAGGGGGRFRRWQKRPFPSGAILCWIIGRASRDRPGRARTRRTTWNLQECFSPRAMRPIGSDFRRARSSAIGGRAKVRCFTALAGTCAICRRTLKPGPKRGGARRLETRETPVGRRHDGTTADRRGGRPGTGKAQGGLCGRPTAGLVAAMLGLPAHAGRVARRAPDARMEGMGSPRVNRPGMQRCGVRVEART